jgi:histidinol-phosphatase (PHP family)
MIANYHTHTIRCRHADGTDEEYIQKAIAEGVKILGFSDHAPYLYPKGYVSYYKMTPDESGEYYSSLKALAKKYEEKIEIRIGYEAEYYPEIWDATFEFWKSKNSPEYLILGQHYITEEYAESAVHSATGTDSPEMLARYADLVCEAIAKRCFTYVAHPDVIKFKGDLDLYRTHMRKIIKTACEYGTPLEINLLGISEGRNYPNEEFWALASQYSPKVILGTDAHSPKRVAVKEEIATALRFADKHKLNVIDTLELINPFK